MLNSVQPICHPKPLIGETFADYSAQLNNLSCLKEHEDGWNTFRKFLEGERDATQQ